MKWIEVNDTTTTKDNETARGVSGAQGVSECNAQAGDDNADDETD